jgi:ferredoxin-NADP reductase
MKAKVKEIIQETKEVKTFVLKTKEKYSFIAGQYANFSITKDDKKLSRTFSISRAPNEKEISFTTIISNSDFKQTINAFIGGEEIEVSKAMGEFTLEKAKGEGIVFLVGGIGITPVKSILENLKKKEDKRDITLLYSNKTIERIVFKEKLEEINEDWNVLKIINFISQENISKEDFPKDFEEGRITKEAIETFVGDIASKTIYIVGPPSFVKAMKEITQEMYLLEDHIITEDFSGY